MENVRKHIVGCDEGCSSYKVRAIFRCPKCESLFWFHLDYVFAEWVFEDMEER
jgi:hypothetical protein